MSADERGISRFTNVPEATPATSKDRTVAERKIEFTSLLERGAARLGRTHVSNLPDAPPRSAAPLFQEHFALRDNLRVMSTPDLTAFERFVKTSDPAALGAVADDSRPSPASPSISCAIGASGRRAQATFVTATRVELEPDGEAVVAGILARHARAPPRASARLPIGASTRRSPSSPIDAAREGELHEALDAAL
jgi:hypothetical protein